MLWVLEMCTFILETLAGKVEIVGKSNLQQEKLLLEAPVN